MAFNISKLKENLWESFGRKFGPQTTRWWLYFHPENWGRFPIWLIFFKCVVQPPTSYTLNTSPLAWRKPMDGVEHLEPHKTSQVLLFVGSRQNVEVGGSCEACPCPDLYNSIKYDPQGVTISAGCWSWNKCFPRRACETAWLDGCEVFCFASCPLSILDSICWDAPR